MLELKDIVYSNDDEDVGAEADINNLDTHIPVSPIPTTRIHKDHPVWTLVDLPNGKRAIGTKWVYRNKKDEKGIVIKNKARLVAQGYTQEEGIDYDEILGGIRWMSRVLFLYEKDRRVSLCLSTPRFEDPDFPDRVYKVEKALYGLHQAPRAWKHGIDKEVHSIGCCQFLGCRLISWQCNKQTVVANSTTEVEYIDASNCCGQIQTLVDKKKVIVTETSVRSDLQLEDAEGTECLPNGIIFEQLTLMRQGKDFSGRDTPLFPTMIVQAQEQEGEGSVMPNVPQHTPTINPPSTSKPHKKQSKRKQRKDTEVSQPSDPTKPMADETDNMESIPTHSNDPLLSGEDRLKQNELTELCTSLSQRVIALETTKTNQALEIDSLKKRVKKLEKNKGSRTHRLRRLFKGRKIADLDVDAEVTLVDEAQGRNDDNLMFDTRVLDEQKVKVEKKLKQLNPRLQEELQAELEEEERLAKQEEEDANIAEWDDDGKKELQEGNRIDKKAVSKRAGEELESDNLKKQKLDKNVEAEVDDEAEMKKHMEIVPDDEVAIDAIPLATKPPIIVD
ncbi:copia protein [Tanacetum coccineum]